VTIEEGTRANHVLTINGQITIAGTVEGNVVAVGDSVVLARRAVVKGNVFTLGGVVVTGKGAEVHGTVTEINSSNISEVITRVLSDEWEGWSWVFAIFSLTIFFSVLIIAVLIVLLLPKPIQVIADAIREETVKITLWGLLGMVLVVPLAVLLTISVIGIVLIPLEMILVVSAGLLGFIAISQLLGRRLYALFKRPSQHILRETFWGLVVLWIIGWLPYIGWMIKVLALMMGLGAVIYTRFGTHAPRRLSSANINV
jgi:MFS family permease